ncbi:MAG: hypothetical protein PVH87_10260 [Desulfobacteraceae bacterium]
MVRSTGGSAKMPAATLHHLINDVMRNKGDETIRVFRREKIDSDICIVLFHGGRKTKTGGSSFGLRLADALKEVGLVRHTIWHEFGS